MKKNNFAEEWKEYKAICDEFEAIDKATDNDGDLDPVRDKMTALRNRIDDKGDEYSAAFRGYKEAQVRGNEYIDIDDCIWDRNVPGLIDGFRKFGIEHFTFSSTWSEAIQTAWLFTEQRCSLEGLVQINGRDPEDKKPAYLFKVN